MRAGELDPRLRAPISLTEDPCQVSNSCLKFQFPRDLLPLASGAHRPRHRQVIKKKSKSLKNEFHKITNPTSHLDHLHWHNLHLFIPVFVCLEVRILLLRSDCIQQLKTLPSFFFSSKLLSRRPHLLTSLCWLVCSW